ncbi:MBL fold metallo-hydrolase [Candidatus Poseidoniaceae archaeon]|nr:MBL fold metallo-hydrolase [Candidatus Poseidoniaceae archaeon]
MEIQGSDIFIADWNIPLTMVFYSPGRTTSYPEIPPDSGIRYHYLGGGNEVGNVGCVFEDKNGTRMLLDYGLAPTDPPKYPREAPSVKDAVITHSHIDHLGMAPWLCSNHRTRLHGTALTAKISHMMWNDCYKVSRIEGYPLAWDKRDIDEATSSWYTHKFGETWEKDSWKLKLTKAGHIPGAAMLNVETDTHKLLFTGDFDTRDSPLTSGAKPEKCDVLFVEGTYGGRDHPPKEETIQSFIERVVEVKDRGGTVLIPSFANGRTQDIVMTLHKHLPELDVHVDGMGKYVAKLQMEHPEALRDPSALEDAWKWCKRVSSKSDKKKALNADCIVSTSGMMDGGPSIWYLNRLRENTRNAILLTGYQAKGSGGRMLLDEKQVPIWGKRTPIDLEVSQYSFSTHAGHSEIVDFAKQCEAETVVVYHTDPNHARPPLVEELESNGHTVHTPINGQSTIIP